MEKSSQEVDNRQEFKSLLTDEMSLSLPSKDDRAIQSTILDNDEGVGQKDFKKDEKFSSVEKLTE